jgi:hypothetical protein
LNSASITAHRDSADLQSSNIPLALQDQQVHVEKSSQDLEGLQLKADSASIQNQALHTELVEQRTVTQKIGSDLTVIHGQTSTIREVAAETNRQVSAITGQNTTILHTATQLLDMATSGMLTLQSLGNKLNELFQICIGFTVEMRDYARQIM